MKCLENSLLMFWRNSNARVGDADFERYLIFGTILQVDGYSNFSFFCKLERISDKIYQHLFEPRGIAHNPFWNLRCYTTTNSYLFVPRP